ncbi:hypothetical protein NM962_01230 [Mycobacterium sp. SVM_VP21]|nr:hypothetical protein NM962_01230 [Mycobacterium sp. SVM_VP21]
MVSHNPEKSGVTVNVTPVLDTETLEAIAKQIEQRITAAVSTGLIAGVNGLAAALGVDPAIGDGDENGAG